MLQNQRSLFLMYAFHLLEMGFPVLGLGKGGRWMMLQTTLSTCE